MGSSFSIDDNDAKRGFYIHQFLATDISSLLRVLDFTVGRAISLGMSIFALSILRRQEIKFMLLFAGFELYNTAFLARITVSISLFLWTWLLIIPGMFATISYSMTIVLGLDMGRISST